MQCKNVGKEKLTCTLESKVLHNYICIEYDYTFVNDFVRINVDHPQKKKVLDQQIVDLIRGVSEKFVF